MSISSVSGLFSAYQYMNKMQKTAARQTSFTGQLKDTAESNGATRLDEYTEYLKARYGANVMVQNVGKDQASFDRLGAGTAGYNNVVIAPNILEQMANDPEKATYYEQKIQCFFDSFPQVQAQFSAGGFEIQSRGMVIHPDGTVTSYVSADLKPEVRAKIEAKIRAEQAEKQARRQKYQELSEEAAAKRRELLAIQNQKQLMAEALRKSMLYAGTNLYITNPSQAVDPATMAYQGTMSQIASIPTETVLAMTQAQVLSGGATL